MNLNKRTIVIFSFLLFLAAVLSTYYFKTKKPVFFPTKAIVESFNSSGAHFTYSEICFKSEMIDLNEECQTENSLNKMINRMIVDLAYNLNVDFSIINPESVFIEQKNDHIEISRITGETDFKEYIDIYKETEKHSSRKSIIKILVKGSEPFGRMQHITEIIGDIFKDQELQFDVDYFITGCFNGPLGNEEMNNVCRKVFNRIKGEKVDNNIKKGLIMVSAFSPVVGKKIEAIDSEANFNITFKYSTYDKNTYIWIRTPGYF